MMHYEKFRRSVAWNTLEGIAIPALLAANQLLLFRVLSRPFYGLTAVLFSLIFMGIPLINVGFDISLPIYLRTFIKNRMTVRRLLLPQFGYQAVLVLITTSAYIGILYWLNKLQGLALPWPFFVLLFGIIYAESIKRSLRVFSQSCFFNKPTTLIEISAVVGYMIMVWGYYIMYGSLNIWVIFTPLLIESVASSLALLFFVLRPFYNTLAVGDKVKGMHLRVLKNRVLGYCNQLSMLFFSRNFLIPFLSWIFGLATVGMLKLVSELAIFVLVFIEKVFGSTGGALLAHVKLESLQKKRKAFTILASHLFSILLSVVIFLVFNGNMVFCLYCGPIVDYYLGLLFFFVIIFENIFLIYERFAIIEERVSITILVNLISAGICFPFIVALHTSLALSIVTIIVTRIVAFLVLSSVYYTYWKIPQRISLNWLLIGFVLILSIVLFYFTPLLMG